MRFHVLRLMLLLSFVCSATQRLGAQRRDTVTTDSSANVPTRRRHPLPPVIVTGSLSTFSQDKLGVARSVIGGEDLRAEPARSAITALRRVTGVYIDEATGPLGPTIIRLRGGEETFTQVLVDGVPINENGGFFDAEGITLVNVDRVEIARGPQSALYGSSAMSGVVQLFTRPGEGGSPHVEALVEGGRVSSYGGSLRATVETGGGSDVARYSIGLGSAFDRGPYALPNNLRANDASVRADYLGDAFSLTAVARYMGVNAMLPVRDPGATRAPLDPNQRQSRDRTIGSLQATWMPSSRWTHRLSLSHYRRYFTYEDMFVGIDQTQFTSYVFDANYYYNSIVQHSTARYVGTITGGSPPPGGLGVALSYGGEWDHESLRDQQSGDFGPASQSVARPSVSVFGEAHMRVADRLSLLFGSRVERFHGLAAAYVPRATAVIDVVPKQLAFRGAVSRAYKAPNIQDQFPNQPSFVANPDLKPETSHSWEIGADARVAAWHTTASVTYFHQNFENLIRSVQYDSTRQINRNLGRSRATGIETEIVLTPRPRWSVGGQAAWTKTRIIESVGLPPTDFPQDSSLPFRPAYTASAFVGTPIGNKVSALVRATAIGSQTALAYRFNGPRVPIAPYAVLGTTVTGTISSSMETYLQLENILNRRYDLAYDRSGLPRSAALGVRVRQ